MVSKPELEPSFPCAWGADCPPPDAMDATGTYFRRVSCAPPSAECFLSYEELGRKVSAAARCKSRGLSVFTVLEDAKAYAERYPDGGTLIARAVLDHTDGKAMPTGPCGTSHTTWWPYPGIARHKKFSVLP